MNRAAPFPTRSSNGETMRFAVVRPLLALFIALLAPLAYGTA